MEFIGCDQGHHLVRELSFVVRIVIHLRRIIFWLMDQLYPQKGIFVVTSSCGHLTMPFILSAMLINKYVQDVQKGNFKSLW